ncbi:hypothetical protein CRUP_017683, partial [Coryphaenoides rupestris]
MPGMDTVESAITDSNARALMNYISHQPPREAGGRTLGSGGRAMEDPWGAAVLGFQVWVAVLLGLVLLPAMFGVSLGVTGVYIQILVHILEFSVSSSTGIIKREGGSMEQEMLEMRGSLGFPPQDEGRGFALADVFYFHRKGVESIVDDQKLPLHQPPPHADLGRGRRRALRPSSSPLSAKEWLSELVHLMCYRICARGLSATIHYHNKENRPKKGGICVANHTTPIDIVILANDGCYAMVGQVHGGLMGVIQKSMVRSCPHVWFERTEMRDRNTVTNRLREHVACKNKLPILIFPEGTCINNTSVMMFKKGSFEIGGTIYPVAIKYDPRFGDAFWNSGKYNMVSYLLRMMTSWAIVVNVWYLPPVTRK